MVKRIGVRAAALSAVGLLGLAVVGLMSDDVKAFYCNNSALEDPSNYYCGYQRGNYVLRSNGVALIPSADDDDKAKLIVREPQAVGEVQERTLVSYGDVLEFGEWGEARVGGIGSNPHINEAGQVVFQATTDYYDYSGNGAGEPGNLWFNYADTLAGLFVSDAGGEPQFVAGSGTELSGSVVCGAGLQPWPFMGEGGDFVFSATVADARGSCDHYWNGDADARQEYYYNVPSYVEGLAPVARITRLVAGPVADASNSNSARSVTIYYEELDGQSVDPAATNYRVLMNRGVFFPGSIIFPANIGDPTLDANWTLTQNGTTGNYTRAEISGSAFGNYTCPPAGCDVDLVATGQMAYIGATGSSSVTLPWYGGARYIARGSIGSSEIEVPLKAIRVPSLADESTQLTVSASDAVNVTPGNPLAVGGEVTFSLRHATAISHAGRMVADDGSFAVFAGVQERVDDSPWVEDYFNYGSDYGNEFRSAVVHVDAAGVASLVATTTPEFAQITGAQVTESGDVMYRATSQRNREDDWTYSNNEACMSYSGLWVGADDSPAAFPTGVGSARNGAWAYEGTIRVYASAGGSEFQNYYSSGYRSRQSYFSVATDNPTANSDYFLEVSNIQEESGGMYCGTLANVTALATAVEDGSARIRLERDRITSVMKVPNLGNASIEFAPSNVQVTVWEGASNTNPSGSVSNRTYYEADGAIRKWSASTGATTDIFRWNQTAPGGFALIRGTPPHYSSGAGVVGFKAGLWTPHMGFWGGSGGNPFPIYDSSNPIATILGHEFPCDPTWDEELYGPDYLSRDESCDGIFVSEGGELKEIARTKRAELAFRSQADADLVGVTEVDGFEFYEFGSTVAVSDTGTVFFNALDYSQDKTAALPGQEVACTETEMIARVGPSDSGGNGRGSSPASHSSTKLLDGVFAYKDGVVEKVMAELDVITDASGQQAIVMAIALPQPELRQAVAGDEILLKFAADTDGDCVEDMVGSVKAMAPQGMSAEQPSNTVLYPDVGTYAAVNSSQGGRIRLAVAQNDRAGAAEGETGWVITNLEVLDPEESTYLTEDEMNGSLISFTAVYNECDGQTCASADAIVDLEMETEASVDRVIGLYKDMEAKPDLIASISESASGGSIIAFSIEDNGPYDADDRVGVATDPSGISLVPLAAFVPSIPVPVMGQALMMILGGLMSLLGGLAAWRRREP